MVRTYVVLVDLPEGRSFDVEPALITTIYNVVASYYEGSVVEVSNSLSLLYTREWVNRRNG